MTAESIGNGSSSVDTEVYEIQKLDENEMILKNGEMISEYKRVNDNNKAILKGKLTLGHEANSFKPCGSDKVFWILDKTGTLQNAYDRLTKNKEAYSPIFVEIEIIDKGKAEDGFPADYDSTYEIINILEAREVSDRDCE